MVDEKIHKTIHLHIYFGKQGMKGIITGEDGSVKNQNQLLKLSYGSISWINYLKNIVANGVIKVKVLGFLNKVNADGSFDYEEAPASISQEINSILNPVSKVVLTPDQKRIADLEAKIEALSSGGNMVKEAKAEKPVVAKDTTPDVNEELESAREKYLEVVGKKPHHAKKLAGLNEEIEAKLAEQN